MQYIMLAKNLHFLYVVHQGSVKVSRYNEDGMEQVVRVLNSGDLQVKDHYLLIDLLMIMQFH